MKRPTRDRRWQVGLTVALALSAGLVPAAAQPANGSGVLTVPAPTPDAAGPAAPVPVRLPPNAAGSRARAVSPRKPASWSDRGFVSINGTFQGTSNAFTDTTTLTQYVESGSVTTTYAATRPLVLDLAGTARVWRNLGVGAAATWLTQDGDGTVSANIPHPFLFNAPRTVTGAVTGVPRQELALHMNVSWVVPAGRLVQFAIFGGPSYFRVKQGLVTGVSTSSVYPYDTATFVGATVSQSWQSQLGGNAGVDAIIRLSKYLGAGAIVRYSRASVHVPVTGSEDVEIRAGGLQVGGGVRVRF